MDTVVDIDDDAMSRQGRQGPDNLGRPDDEPAEFVSLKEATFAVQKSDKTIRRLIKAGKVRFSQEEPNGSYLVDLRTLRTIFADSPVVSVDGQPRHMGSQHLDTGTQCLDTSKQALSTPETVLPQSDPFAPVRLLSEELERIRKELTETRSQTRLEIEAKEQRIQNLTDQLIAAKQDAGKWQQAEEYRQQLYRDFGALQERYQEARVRLELLEHNPVVTRQGSQAIDVEAKVLEAEPPRTIPTTAKPGRRERNGLATATISAVVLILLAGIVWVAYMKHLAGGL